jgi:TonB family protein
MAESWKHWEGRAVDGFPLSRYLGGSDHSCVFLTERAGRERRSAAIKLIQASTANWQSQVSWWRQIEKFHHPHLLQLFETGRCQLDGNELFYCVMEYAEENLGEIFPDRPLTSKEARNMLRPVLDALAYIHSRGFVHGHIKPSNILAAQDQVKLSVDRACPVGENGRVLGLPGIYGATEVATDECFSPALDVLSLGTVLVEGLTQRPPVWRAERGDPVLPKALPAPFLEIARNCLRRVPKNRWTVDQITARLDQSPAARRKQSALRVLLAKPAIILPSFAAAILLLAMTAVPRLLNLHQETPEHAVESSAAASGTAPGLSSAPGVTNAAIRNPPPASPVSAFSPGAVAQQPLPDVPKSAQNTIHGTIRVRLRLEVDSAGNVTTARFISYGASRYFARLALGAAEQWKFTPPQVDGQGTPSEWILLFEFSKTDISAHSTPLHP